MNIEEIKQLIETLVPAGQAVQSTAMIYMAKEMLAPVLTSTVIITVVVMLLRHLKWQRNAEIKEEEKEFLKGLKIGEKVVSHSSLVNYADHQRLEGALLEYFNRHGEVTHSKYFGRSIKMVKEEKLAELVKFLRNN